MSLETWPMCSETPCPLHRSLGGKRFEDQQIERAGDRWASEHRSQQAAPEAGGKQLLAVEQLPGLGQVGVGAGFIAQGLAGHGAILIGVGVIGIEL